MHIINRSKSNQVFNNTGMKIKSLQPLILNSTPNQISKLEDYVKQVMVKCNIKKELYPNILISLTEAVNNAIIHGNKKDEKKTVCIKCQEKQQSLVIKIIDQGNGFNPLQVRDPRSPGRISECGGRGVLIMHELCDRVHYHNKGTEVEIHFKL